MSKRDISEEIRYKIVHLHKEGQSQRKISKKTGVSKTGVQKILKRYRENGTPNNQGRPGRPRKLSPDDKRYLEISSLIDRTKSSSALASDLKESTGVSVHPSTVRRQRSVIGLRGCVAIKKLTRRKDEAKIKIKEENEEQIIVKQEEDLD